jgi:hypothetical protein
MLPTLRPARPAMSVILAAAYPCSANTWAASDRGHEVRLGLPGEAGSVEEIIRAAERAEADGFSSLW